MRYFIMALLEHKVQTVIHIRLALLKQDLLMKHIAVLFLYPNKLKSCLGILLAFFHCSFGFSKTIVTNPYRTDGFGSQFQTIIYSIIFAELHDQTFLYTPIQTMPIHSEPCFAGKWTG